MGSANLLTIIQIEPLSGDPLSGLDCICVFANNTNIEIQVTEIGDI